MRLIASPWLLWSAAWIILVALATPVALVASEPWSGIIVVEQVHLFDVPRTADARTQRRVLQQMEARLEQVRGALPSASGDERDVLLGDQVAYETDIERLRQAVAGRVEQARTEYRITDAPVGTVTEGLGGARMLVVGDGFTVTVDRAMNQAEITGDEPRTEPLTDPPPISLEPARGGEPVLGHQTLAIQVDSAQGTFRVLYAVDLPNPHRIGLLASTPDDALTRALAALPGMPMRIIRRTNRGEERWEVIRIEARALTEADWQPRGP